MIEETNRNVQLTMATQSMQGRITAMERSANALRELLRQKFGDSGVVHLIESLENLGAGSNALLEVASSSTSNVTGSGGSGIYTAEGGGGGSSEMKQSSPQYPYPYSHAGAAGTGTGTGYPMPQHQQQQQQQHRSQPQGKLTATSKYPGYNSGIIQSASEYNGRDHPGGAATIEELEHPYSMAIDNALYGSKLPLKK
jgi:hypothetical protein